LVSYRVYEPEGQVIMAQEDYAMASGRQQDPKIFVLAQPSLTLNLKEMKFADKLKKGPYIVEAEVLDKVSKRKTWSRQRVTLE
jgi:hypothetical protein